MPGFSTSPRLAPWTVRLTPPAANVALTFFAPILINVPLASVTFLNPKSPLRVTKVPTDKPIPVPMALSSLLGKSNRMSLAGMPSRFTWR